MTMSDGAKRDTSPAVVVQNRILAFKASTITSGFVIIFGNELVHDDPCLTQSMGMSNRARRELHNLSREFLERLYFKKDFAHLKRMLVWHNGMELYVP